MKLVRFENGMYGVARKKFFFFTEFLSLEGVSFWWSDRPYVYAFCMGSKEQAEAAMKKHLGLKWGAVDE